MPVTLPPTSDSYPSNIADIQKIIQKICILNSIHHNIAITAVGGACEALATLESVLHDWVEFKLADGHNDIPVMGGVDVYSTQFEDPFPEGNHQMMNKEQQTLNIPDSSNDEISPKVIRDIITQAGISVDEWLSIE